VLRKRATLEDLGLIDKVGVEVHPSRDPASRYPGTSFDGLGLRTNHTFDLAYNAALEFTELLGKRTKSAGFMRSLMLQRICSSFASGRKTAEAMLRRALLDDEEDAQLLLDQLDGLTPREAACLRVICDELARPEAHDPKLDAITYFLGDHHTDGRTWLEHGCILFSQYYDTAEWVAARLAVVFPSIPIGIYAGAGRSKLLVGGKFVVTGREQLKERVRTRELRLLVATDAACEGLNLQTLGTLVNVDLPWNPSRLEQRLGRIKRFGQSRSTVDMLNLVYKGTRDEDVYRALSKRMKDRYDLFGGLPDTIDDAWIDSEAHLEEEMDRYLHLRDEARNAFDVRYGGTIDPDGNRWETCSRVFSRRDVVDKLSEPW